MNIYNTRTSALLVWSFWPEVHGKTPQIKAEKGKVYKVLTELLLHLAKYGIIRYNVNTV